MSQTHWKKLTNPNYLGAYSLDEGKDIVLTIKEVKMETVVGSDGKREDCAVCYWMEREKPMIMNTTNLRMVAKLTGSPYIEKWPGTPVQIGTEKVRAFGTVTDALRIRDVKPSQTAQDAPVACEQCGQVIQPCFGMSAAQWAKYSKEKMGHCLCEDCANKAAEAAKK
jgi:hypothetical protein